MDSCVLMGAYSEIQYKHKADISSPGEVLILNEIANGFLFIHPAAATLCSSSLGVMFLAIVRLPGEM